MVERNMMGEDERNDDGKTNKEIVGTPFLSMVYDSCPKFDMERKMKNV